VGGNAIVIVGNGIRVAVGPFANSFSPVGGVVVKNPPELGGVGLVVRILA
jgi:hypothetical protein